ncbi:TPA: hypothetical protein NIA41_000498 [Pseudomonas aeruginosa]|nr:hypothetical protein [Pseudomonas aeruginosa]
MKHPSIEDIFQAVGKDSESAPLQTIFSCLEIGVDQLRKYPANIKGRRIWSSDAGGLQLEFKDIGLLREIPYHDVDEGPWVLTNVIFWGEQEGSDIAYGGPKPYELDYSMDRDTVRSIMLSKNMGAPSILGVAGNVDMWAIGSTEVKVNYSKSKGIRSISVGVLIERKRS